MQPADQLLLALLRVASRDASGEVGSAEAVVGPADSASWRQVLARARAHQVEPQALWALDRLPEAALDSSLAAEIKARRRAWTLRALRQEQALSSAWRALADAGIPALVLKGPALGRFAYGDPMRRPAADMDLLVPGERHPSAMEALGRLGWRLRDAAQSNRYHHPHHYHDILVDGAGGVLELHWSLSRPDDFFHLDPAEFTRRAVPGDGGQLYPAPTDLLLHTAAQALGEGYSRLLRVVDADGLLRRQRPRLDWERLVGDARRSGLAPALWLLVEIAVKLLGSPPPPRPLPEPSGLARRALDSLEPAVSLAGGFARRHSSMRRLYSLWLAPDGSRRLRAAVRLFRAPRQERARWPDGWPWRQRAAAAMGRARGALKLAAYQVAALMRPAPRVE